MKCCAKTAGPAGPARSSETEASHPHVLRGLEFQLEYDVFMRFLDVKCTAFEQLWQGCVKVKTEVRRSLVVGSRRSELLRLRYDFNARKPAP